MHAYKQRSDESYIPVQRRAAVAVAIDGSSDGFVAYASPARTMHDDLVQRLTSTGESAAVDAGGLSMLARLGIIAVLALAAWIPVGAIGLLLLG